MNSSNATTFPTLSQDGDKKGVSLWWYHTCRRIIHFLLRLFYRIEVSGVENVPKEGAAVLAINHLHWLDPPLLLIAIPQRVITPFVAIKYKDRFFVGWFLHSMNGIFVRRQGVDRQALKEGLVALESGGVLGLAPEGTRSKTGSLQRAPSGLAYIAHKSGAPVLPVVIYGHESAPLLMGLLTRPKVKVVIGEPFSLPPLKTGDMSQQLAANTDIVMRCLADMLPPRYRGVYS